MKRFAHELWIKKEEASLAHAVGFCPRRTLKSDFFFLHILEQGGLLGRCARNTETSAVNPAGAMLRGRIGNPPCAWQRILFFFRVDATAHPMRGLASAAGPYLSQRSRPAAEVPRSQFPNNDHEHTRSSSIPRGPAPHPCGGLCPHVHGTPTIFHE